MSSLSIGRATPPGIVLPFYATGAFAFLILCLLLTFNADSLTGHYFNPHLLTIVHTAALGWGVMIIFGAVYQLLPVICEHDLRYNRLAEASWYFLTLGVAFLSYSFWDFRTGLFMLTGGGLIVVAVVLFCMNVFFIKPLQKKPGLAHGFIMGAAAWLLFTVVVGFLLATNLRFPFFTINHMDVLRLHAHAGLAGFFLLLITGVSSKLVPMFVLGNSKKTYLLLGSFILQNTGLILFLIDLYFVEYSIRVFIYAGLILAGIVLWGMYIYDAFVHRLRRNIDYQMRHVLLSAFSLIIAFVIIPWIYFTTDLRWSVLYGMLLFMGWITGIILGMTFKTLPFIVWNHHYKSLTGKMTLPLPRDLFYEKLVQIQFYVYALALILLAAGVIYEHMAIIQAAMVVWVITASLYLFNVLKILLHRQKVSL